MARASAGVMSAARTVKVSASTAASAATRTVFVFMVVVFRPLMNMRLVVLIFRYIVACKPNDTVSVLEPCGILSTTPLLDLAVYRTLGQYMVRATAVFIYHALLATPGTARDASVGHGSGGHPDDVDKQGASSPIGWRSAFKNARVVDEIVTGELRVAKFNDKVRDVVATKDRERGIRIVLKETVLSLTPERNELAGLHVSGKACRAISEAHCHWVHSPQYQFSFVECYVLRVLHEQHIHVARLLPGRSPGYQRIFIGRFGWRLRMGRR